MRTKILILTLALFALPAGAADLITRWLVITNAPIGNTNSVTLNGSTRTYTNTPSSSPSTLIQETNVIGWAATNTANQLTTYRVSFGHQITLGTNYVAVRGAVGENLTLSINACCFGYITNSTQSVAVPTYIVRVPLTTEAATNRVNIASLLVQGQSTSSTQAFATNSSAISNALIKGASPLQTVSSPMQFFGRTAVNSNFFATNGFTSALTNINPVTSNLVNYGNAIRSEGIGGVSLQLGSNAVAAGLRSVAIGNNAYATNNDSTAIGTSSIATNKGTAIGRAAVAGAASTAIGDGANAAFSDSVAIGPSVLIDGPNAIGISANSVGAGTIAIGKSSVGDGTNNVIIGGFASDVSGLVNSVAIGYGASVTHSNAAVFGAYAPSSGSNQVSLGASTTWVQSPGIFAANTHTNTTLKGTNVINGRVDFTSRANTSLANGNNAGVVLGTNVYVRFPSGPTAAYTINGIAAEVDGSWHIAEFINPVNSLTIADNSGTDPVAANRIRTGTGADVVFTNNPVVLQFIYNSTDARWKIANWFR